MARSQTLSVVEDGTLNLTLMANDPDNDPLTFNITTQPLKGTLSGTGAARTYTPAPDANGPDNFSFTANDGSNTSAAATVTINITPVNDVPTAANSSIAANSGQSTPILLMGSDADGEPLTYELVKAPTNGTLSNNGPLRLYVSNTGFAGTDLFIYRVRDATSVSGNATVTINVMGTAAPNPAPARGGGGGGAMNELLLLSLGLLAMAARRLRLHTPVCS